MAPARACYLGMMCFIEQNNVPPPVCQESDCYREEGAADCANINTCMLWHLLSIRLYTGGACRHHRHCQELQSWWDDVFIILEILCSHEDEAIGFSKLCFFSFRSSLEYDPLINPYINWSGGYKWYNYRYFHDLFYSCNAIRHLTLIAITMAVGSLLAQKWIWGQAKWHGNPIQFSIEKKCCYYDRHLATTCIKYVYISWHIMTYHNNFYCLTPIFLSIRVTCLMHSQVNNPLPW